jgi:hypothetical protein
MNRSVYFPPAIFDAIKERQKVSGETFNKIVSLALSEYLKLDNPTPTKIESKPPKEVKVQQPTRKVKETVSRPLSRSELFRSISNNRA